MIGKKWININDRTDWIQIKVELFFLSIEFYNKTGHLIINTFFTHNAVLAVLGIGKKKCK